MGMVDWRAWAIGGIAFDILSGVLFVAFGLFVGLKRPRTRAGNAAAAFCIGLGIFVIGSNLNNFQTQGHIDPPQDTPLAIANLLTSAIGLIVADVGILLLVRRLLGHWPTRATSWLLLACAVAGGISAVHNDLAYPAPGAETGPLLWLWLATGFLYALLTPLLLWMAVSLEGKDRSAQLTAMAAVPFAAAWTLTRTMQWFGTPFFPGVRFAFLSIPLAILIFACGRRPTSQRLFAWTAMWSLAAFLWGWGFQDHDPTNLGFNGLTRVIAVFLLGYAVVRHRAFDIDLKLRFTLKQSTLAAVFIAVFVGVQSLVGEFFTATAGLIGGAVATAILVFALAPLQAMAERVAHRALPHATPIPARPAEARSQLYAELAAAAWADGLVTAKEANVLETARVQLGLSLEQAHRLDATARRASSSTHATAAATA